MPAVVSILESEDEVADFDCFSDTMFKPAALWIVGLLEVLWCKIKLGN